MSLQGTTDDRDYDKLKSEHEILLEKYRRLKAQFAAHLASCSHQDVHDDSSESLKPSAKKQPLLNVADPFEMLLPELVDEVLKFFKPKELVDITSVSQGWKSFIESNSKRMKGVMEGIVLKIKADSVQKMDVMTFDDIFDGGRKYKHMDVDFGLSLSIQRFPFISYSSSLVSLKLTCKSIDCHAPSADFPLLNKLIIECEIFEDGENGDECFHSPIMKFIAASSFPEVTHLKVPEFDINVTSFRSFIENFPKLKVFNLLGSPESWDSLVPYRAFESQPKIEAFYLDATDYYDNIFHGFKDTLTEVYLGIANGRVVEHLLENLTNLQKLAIGGFFPTSNLLELEPHKKLQTFSIGRNPEDMSDWIYEIFPALPSLSLLIVRDKLGLCLCRYIASHLPSVKKLVAQSASEEAMEFLRSMQEGENDFINPSFELVLDPEMAILKEEFSSPNFA